MKILFPVLLFSYHKKLQDTFICTQLVCGVVNGALPVIRHMPLRKHALTLNSARASSSAISTVYIVPLITSAVQNESNFLEEHPPPCKSIRVYYVFSFG